VVTGSDVVDAAVAIRSGTIVAIGPNRSCRPPSE